MLGKLAASLKRIWDREPWWAEFWTALGAIGWAFLVFATNTGMSGRPSLAVLGSLMDDNCWAALACCIGIGQLIALFAYRQWARWAMCLIASSFWWFCVVAICHAGSIPGDTAAIPLALALYCMAALPCSYSVLRLPWDLE